MSNVGCPLCFGHTVSTATPCKCVKDCGRQMCFYRSSESPVAASSPSRPAPTCACGHTKDQHRGMHGDGECCPLDTRCGCAKFAASRPAPADAEQVIALSWLDSRRR